jgi:pilus assembly protein FimV
MATPGYGNVPQTGRGTTAVSGTGASADPANEPGQYPSSLFGVALPRGTGAAGSAGASGAADPSNEPGQLTEGISGTGPADNADTGAPGTAGATESAGGPDSVSYTRPGSFLSGTNVAATVNDTISGTGDWTQAVDGSYGGGPQLPGIAGNMPASTGAGAGRVLRGGRAVR